MSAGGDGEQRGRMAGGVAREGCTASSEGDGAEEGGAQRDRREAAATYGGAASGTEGGGCDGGHLWMR